ncbi:hypothetical protein N7462_009443 [Penicillium macrosclerotiorum]|uniref:uncharacterized protein n=1 Tax=Penicillium macrosclerotiorum TaxID=303699 RepID=UPI0025476D43|nr:uncharacterized protein N7462_009443 [Penicillium macrosclerotiorum]KAJ5674004.1 hypothetical protein N7462_009443 [Penicillium macrosclerotiorum]
MPRTRSTAPSEQTEPKQDNTTLTSVEKPSKSFIIPSNVSANARLVSLPNPQSGELSRYFFCPERGLYEFTVIASSPQLARSILFTPDTQQSTPGSEDERKVSAAKASIAKKAELLVATPIDAIFFLIPLFSLSSKSGQSLFQPLDDMIDSNDDLPPHLRQILYNETFRGNLLSRAESICDIVEAGDEKMFRFSETKLLKELVAKAERMAAHGLPASMEERFVRQTLAAPLMSVKREDVLTNHTSNENEANLSKSDERPDSPSTVATTTTPSVSTPAGETTPAPQPLNEGSAPVDEIARLQRVSIALSFMKDSYLPQTLCSRVDEMIAAPESPLDFKPLTERLKELVTLRAEALASRSTNDFSRKRGLDDEEVEARADKKRRKEEEEKKSKASESRGVRDLKKVNTSGMKKMSDFFGKAAMKKKT